MSTPTEYQILRQRHDRLREGIAALADEWEAEAAEDQAWLNGPKAEVNEARELPALIRQAGAHVTELRALLAEPAAEDDIRAKVERSSLGTPEAQALRATVSDEHAARIVARAKELDASVPAPTADGGEVEALGRSWTHRLMSHYGYTAAEIAEYEAATHESYGCEPEGFEWNCADENDHNRHDGWDEFCRTAEIVMLLVESPELADVRRTERAEGAREAAERIAAEIEAEATRMHDAFAADEDEHLERMRERFDGDWEPTHHNRHDDGCAMCGTASAARIARAASGAGQ